MHIHRYADSLAATRPVTIIRLSTCSRRSSKRPLRGKIVVTRSAIYCEVAFGMKVRRSGDMSFISANTPGEKYGYPRVPAVPRVSLPSLTSKVRDSIL